MPRPLLGLVATRVCSPSSLLVVHCALCNAPCFVVCIDKLHATCCMLCTLSSVLSVAVPTLQSFVGSQVQFILMSGCAWTLATLTNLPSNLQYLSLIRSTLEATNVVANRSVSLALNSQLRCSCPKSFMGVTTQSLTLKSSILEGTRVLPTLCVAEPPSLEAHRARTLPLCLPELRCRFPELTVCLGARAPPDARFAVFAGVAWSLGFAGVSAAFSVRVCGCTTAATSGRLGVYASQSINVDYRSYIHFGGQSYVNTTALFLNNEISKVDMPFGAWLRTPVPSDVYHVPLQHAAACRHRGCLFLPSFAAVSMPGCLLSAKLGRSGSANTCSWVCGWHVWFGGGARRVTQSKLC